MENETEMNEERYFTCKFFYEDYSEEKDGTEILKYECNLYDKVEKQCIVTKKGCSLYENKYHKSKSI